MTGRSQLQKPELAAFFPLGDFRATILWSIWMVWGQNFSTQRRSTADRNLQRPGSVETDPPSERVDASTRSGDAGTMTEADGQRISNDSLLVREPCTLHEPWLT